MKSKSGVYVSAVPIAYQFDHRTLRHTIEPEHVRILNDAAVVPIHFTPAVSVMQTLSINKPPKEHSSVRAMGFCEELIDITSILGIWINVQIVHRYSSRHHSISTDLTVAQICLKPSIDQNVIIVVVVARSIIMVQRPDSMVVRNHEVLSNLSTSHRICAYQRLLRLCGRLATIV